MKKSKTYLKKTFILIISLIFILIITEVYSTPSITSQKHKPHEILSFKNLSKNTGIFLINNVITNSERIVTVGNVTQRNTAQYYINISSLLITPLENKVTINCCKNTNPKTECIAHTSINPYLTQLNCNQYSSWPLKIKTISTSGGLIIGLERYYSPSPGIIDLGESFVVIWNN